MDVITENSRAVEQASQAHPTVWQQVVAFSEALLLSVWLGSMIFFSFAVAPSAFSVFPDQRELAGRVVTANISKIEMLGLIIGPLLVLIQAVTWRIRRTSGKGSLLRLILIGAIIAAAALSRFWVSAKMVALRASMVVIDTVPADDPRRVEFNDLHQYSVALMGTAMLAGLVVLFLTVRSWLKR